MGQSFFLLDPRLGIRLPAFSQPFEEMSISEQQLIISEWETIRARIPDRVQVFEFEITDRLTKINETEDWDQIVAWFEEISDIASRVAELNTWMRVDPVLS